MNTYFAEKLSKDINLLFKVSNELTWKLLLYFYYAFLSFQFVQLQLTLP